MSDYNNTNNYYYQESQRQKQDNRQKQAEIDKLNQSNAAKEAQAKRLAQEKEEAEARAKRIANSSNTAHAIAVQNGEIAKQNADIAIKYVKEAAYYKQLLSKPMEEIAAQNGDFKATFEKQQEIIADWIVSQKAFRELAIDLGEEFGVSKEAMRKKLSEKFKAVLTDNTKHGNNASENTGDNVLVELTEKTIAIEKAKIGL
nr:hypothetical protein [Thiomonas sp.]